MRNEDHRAITKMLLGSEYPQVHEFMDMPSKLLGDKHRALFHDPGTVMAMLMTRGPKEALASFLHIMCDCAPKPVQLMLLMMLLKNK